MRLGATTKKRFKRWLETEGIMTEYLTYTIPEGQREVIIVHEHMFLNSPMHLIYPSSRRIVKKWGRDLDEWVRIKRLERPLAQVMELVCQKREIEEALEKRMETASILGSWPRYETPTPRGKEWAISVLEATI